MKKTKFFFAAMLLTAISANAQYWNNPGLSLTTVTTTTAGDCNIGGNAYIQNGLIDMTIPGSWTPTTEPWRSITANATYAGLNLIGGNGGAYIGLNGPMSGGGININSSTISGPGFGINFWNHTTPSTFSLLMNISNSGDLTLTDNATIGNNLFVKGGLIDITNGTAGGNIVGNGTSGWLGILGGTNAASLCDGAYLQLFGNSGVGNGAAYIVASGPLTSGTSFYYQPNGGSSVSNMTVLNDGQVVIGNVSTLGTNDYKLYVQTGIITEKLKVANSGDFMNWSDFVFNKDYDLMSLDKVEAFVKENKHLPEIPSASEVAKDGIDVANMDAKLLQKIEELTLYVIKQQKEINDLKKKVTK
jgi:hypothetical protein